MSKYIWTVEFEEHWSYDAKGEYNDRGMKFSVIATDSDKAIARAKTLANVGKKFKDDLDEKKYSLVDVRLIGLTRGQEING